MTKRKNQCKKKVLNEVKSEPISENRRAVFVAKKSKKKIGYLILLIVFTIAFLYFAYQLVTWTIDNHKTSNIVASIKYDVIENSQDNTDQGTGDEGVRQIDFLKLTQMNQDTVGWIQIKGTNIDFPIVQTTDNVYYLKRTFTKEYNSLGWIFMDYQNVPDFSNLNTVIYGHNIKSSTMFSDLKKILSGDLGTKVEITITTASKKLSYQVFSAYSIMPEDYYINTRLSQSQYPNFLNTVEKRSEVRFDTDVSSQEKCITLSTCTDDSQGRIAVHAMLVQERMNEE